MANYAAAIERWLAVDTGWCSKAHLRGEELFTITVASAKKVRLN